MPAIRYALTPMRALAVLPLIPALVLLGVLVRVSTNAQTSRAQTHTPTVTCTSSALGCTQDTRFTHRLFAGDLADIDIWADADGISPVINVKVGGTAQLAVVEIFYNHTVMLEGSSKPTTLLLHARTVCPVVSEAHAMCDHVARYGLDKSTLESIQFVRVKLLAVTHEFEIRKGNGDVTK